MYHLLSKPKFDKELSTIRGYIIFTSYGEGMSQCVEWALLRILFDPLHIILRRADQQVDTMFLAFLSNSCNISQECCPLVYIFLTLSKWRNVYVFLLWRQSSFPTSNVKTRNLSCQFSHHFFTFKCSRKKKNWNSNESTIASLFNRPYFHLLTLNFWWQYFNVSFSKVFVTF